MLRYGLLASFAVRILHTGIESPYGQKTADERSCERKRRERWSAGARQDYRAKGRRAGCDWLADNSLFSSTYRPENPKFRPQEIRSACMIPAGGADFVLRCHRPGLTTLREHKYHRPSPSFRTTSLPSSNQLLQQSTTSLHKTSATNNNPIISIYIRQPLALPTINLIS
jgi:hypothetical protein